MGRAIGELLPLAIGVAMSPIPIIAIVLILGTQHARSNGPAFLVGWVAGLTIVGTVMLVISSGNTTQSTGEPDTWVGVLKLLLGVIFLLLAVRTWRGRPKAGQATPMPKWMQTIDTFTAGKSLGSGVLLSSVNPKNLALTIAAATAIAQTDISSGQMAGALVVFIVIGSLTIIAPLVIYFAMGAKATEILDGLKTWMVASNATIMTVMLLLLGALLLGDGISALSA